MKLLGKDNFLIVTKQPVSNPLKFIDILVATRIMILLEEGRYQEAANNDLYLLACTSGMIMRLTDAMITEVNHPVPVNP